MKKVKILTITLAMILIALVAFGGVYVKKQNRMENKVKEYEFSKELSGARVVEIMPETTTESTENAETEGTETEGSDGTETDAKKSEMLTTDNYRIVKKTIKNRLQNLKCDDYNIALNDEDGKIRVEFPENDNTDTYVYYLTADNKIQVKEKDSETELLDDSMFKKAKYNYTGNAEGKYQVYLELELTKDGQAKIEEVKNNYAIFENEVKEIEDAEKAAEESAKETTEEGTEQTTETKTEEENKTEETTKNNEETKKIAVVTIAGTEFNVDKIEKNKITLKVGSEATDDTSINNNMSRASEIALLINSGKYPVTYENETNRFVHSDITNNDILYFAIAVLAILIIVLCVFIVKYKLKGFLSAISFVGFVALFSLLIRYTNVMISIEGIGAILLILLLNLRFNWLVLEKTQKMNLLKEAMASTYKDLYLKLIPLMIITIVFCFSGGANLNSFGFIMFWGLILVALYNIIVTKPILKLSESK